MDPLVGSCCIILHRTREGTVIRSYVILAVFVSLILEMFAVIERIKILALHNLGDCHHSSVSPNNNSLIPWTSDMGELSMAAFKAGHWLFLPSDTNGHLSLPQMQALRSLDQNSHQLSWFSDV